jgi:hypothetical protein
MAMLKANTMTPYQEIRAAGKAMHSKVLDATRHLDFNPIRIAKRMTLPVAGRTLVFDDEVVQNAFFDFWFHEYQVNGKSLAQSVDPVAAKLTPLEAEVLAAHAPARTSFFLTEAVLPEQHQVRLRDLLEPQASEILLTDLGLSESLAHSGARLAFYCRLVTLRGITMTSGFSFLFRSERVTGLLQAYRQKMKKVTPENLPEQRFIFFFQKYRQMGEEQRYQDVA